MLAYVLGATALAACTILQPGGEHIKRVGHPPSPRATGIIGCKEAMLPSVHFRTQLDRNGGTLTISYRDESGNHSFTVRYRHSDCSSRVNQEMRRIIYTTLQNSAPAGSFVQADCNHSTLRPRRMVLECESRPTRARQLEWLIWGINSAVGTAKFQINDCDPDCRRGTFHMRRGTIRLFERRFCLSEERYLFWRALIKLKKPIEGASEHLPMRMGCPTGLP